MPNFKRQMAGGTSVAAGPLRPHGNRASTAQAASYWGGGGITYNVATGGTETLYTSGGLNYKSHILTTGSSAFTVVSLGTVPTFDILVVGGGGGGGGTGLGRGYGDGGGGAGGFATTTMALPTGTYQATIGAAGSGYGGSGGTSTFGASTSLVTANGGAGGTGCEFCAGTGGAGGTASVGGSLGTSNVTTTGFTGRNGNGGNGQTGPTNTYKDGTTLYYASTAGASWSCQGIYTGGTGAYTGADGSCNQPCSTAPATPALGSGGPGGTSNCGTGIAGYAGYVVVRYRVA